jgi:hypothetical protein
LDLARKAKRWDEKHMSQLKATKVCDNTWYNHIHNFRDFCCPFPTAVVLVWCNGTSISLESVYKISHSWVNVLFFFIWSHAIYDSRLEVASYRIFEELCQIASNDAAFLSRVVVDKES